MEGREAEGGEVCRKGLLGAHFGERLEQLPTEQTLVMEVTPTTIINIDCRRLQAWAGGALGEMEAGWPTPGPPAPTLIFKAVRHQHHLWPRNEEEQQLIFASPSGQTPTSSLAGKRGAAAAHLCRHQSWRRRKKMRVTKGGALDTPCHWGGARVEALVAIRLAGRWSKREKRPPKTCKILSKNVYSTLKCFSKSLVL